MPRKCPTAINSRALGFLVEGSIAIEAPKGKDGRLHLVGVSDKLLLRAFRAEGSGSVLKVGKLSWDSWEGLPCMAKPHSDWTSVRATARV